MHEWATSQKGYEVAHEIRHRLYFQTRAQFSLNLYVNSHMTEEEKRRWKRNDVAVKSHTLNFLGTTSFQTKKL